MSEVSYPLRLKAAVLEETGQPLRIRDVVFPGPPTSGQVVVRLCYSGICGKQIEEILGTGGADPFLPHMLGHEGVGVVIDIGPDVMKVRKGDLVVLHWMRGSGTLGETPRYEYPDGGRVNAGYVTTFNTHAVVSETRVTPIRPDADRDVTCLLGCAVTSGVGCALNESGVGPESDIAVFGCGGIGLNVIQGARILHARRIIAIDGRADALDHAMVFGATHRIAWTGDARAALAELGAICNDGGPKAVVVSTGDPAVVEAAVAASAVPGVVLLVGVPPKGAHILVDPLEIHRGRVVRGSIGGATFPDRHIPEYLEFYRRGELKLRELVTGVVPLSGINRAIDMMISGVGGRFLVDLGGEGDGEL